MDRGVRRAGAAADERREKGLAQTIEERMKKKKKREKDCLCCSREKRALPTESLHAWWFAQDGSEPRRGAGARGGGVVAWGGGVGLEARRGGFVILSREAERKQIQQSAESRRCGGLTI